MARGQPPDEGREDAESSRSANVLNGMSAVASGEKNETVARTGADADPPPQPVPGTQNSSAPPEHAEGGSASANAPLGVEDYVKLFRTDDTKSIVAGFQKESKARLEELGRYKDESGHSLLHWASLFPIKTTPLRWCLETLQCDPGAQALNTLQTPLMWAMTKPQYSGFYGMRMLVHCSEKSLRLRDSMGATALLIAVQHNNFPGFLLCLAASVHSVDDVDQHGCSVAHWAAFKGETTMTKILLKLFGKNLYARVDLQNMNPLMRGVLGGHYKDCAAIVKSKHLDVNAVAKSGATALDMAKAAKNGPISFMIEAAGGRAIKFKSSCCSDKKCCDKVAADQGAKDGANKGAEGDGGQKDKERTTAGDENRNKNEDKTCDDKKCADDDGAGKRNTAVSTTEKKPSWLRRVFYCARSKTGDAAPTAAVATATAATLHASGITGWLLSVFLGVGISMWIGNKLVLALRTKVCPRWFLNSGRKPEDVERQAAYSWTSCLMPMLVLLLLYWQAYWARYKMCDVYNDPSRNMCDPNAWSDWHAERLGDGTSVWELLRLDVVYQFLHEAYFGPVNRPDFFQYGMTFWSCMAVFWYLRVHTMDPGIVVAPATEQGQKKALINYLSMVYGSGGRLDLQTVFRLCETCFVVKDLRTKHCRMSGCCVRNYDHYCPWVGNCVGRGNHRSFLGFVMSTAVALFLLSVRFVQLLYHRHYPVDGPLFGGYFYGSASTTESTELPSTAASGDAMLLTAEGDLVRASAVAGGRAGADGSGSSETRTTSSSMTRDKGVDKNDAVLAPNEWDSVAADVVENIRTAGNVSGKAHQDSETATTEERDDDDDDGSSFVWRVVFSTPYEYLKSAERLSADDWAHLITGVCTFLILAWLLGLTQFHMSGIGGNMNTNEHMNCEKYPWFWVEEKVDGGELDHVFHNPFDLGTPSHNCYDFWFNRECTRENYAYSKLYLPKLSYDGGVRAPKAVKEAPGGGSCCAGAASCGRDEAAQPLLEFVLADDGQTPKNRKVQERALLPVDE